MEIEKSWLEIYNDINRRSEKIYKGVTSNTAKLTENLGRNRYNNVLPSDEFRFKLDGQINDYINASVVTVKDTDSKYVLTQGPLPNTSGHFWLMVWQLRCSGVVMLNQVVESKRIKCHQYFPIMDNDSLKILTFPDVGITVEVKDEKSTTPYSVHRTIELTKNETNDTLTIEHFQFKTWPDFGVPENADEFLSFLNCVRKSGVLSPSMSAGPPVIHCSAGIGRSGTFVLVDSALKTVEKRGSVESLDLVDMVLEMRKCRPGLIQTEDQLEFASKVITKGAKNILKNIRDDGNARLQATVPECSQVMKPKVADALDTKGIAAGSTSALGSTVQRTSKVKPIKKRKKGINKNSGDSNTKNVSNKRTQKYTPVNW